MSLSEHKGEVWVICRSCKSRSFLVPGTEACPCCGSAVTWTNGLNGEAADFLERIGHALYEGVDRFAIPTGPYETS